MKPDPVIATLKIVAAIVAAAGMLTASLGLLAGTISLPLAFLSLATFAAFVFFFILAD